MNIRNDIKDAKVIVNRVLDNDSSLAVGSRPGQVGLEGGRGNRCGGDLLTVCAAGEERARAYASAG